MSDNKDGESRREIAPRNFTDSALDRDLAMFMAGIRKDLEEQRSDAVPKEGRWDYATGPADCRMRLTLAMFHVAVSNLCAYFTSAIMAHKTMEDPGAAILASLARHLKDGEKSGAIKVVKVDMSGAEKPPAYTKPSEN